MADSLPKALSVTVGIDLSDRFTTVCVLDEQGEVLEEGKLRTTPEAFERRFSALEPCRVVMEVGTHSPWASKALAQLGHEIIVANPPQGPTDCCVDSEDRPVGRGDARAPRKIGSETA